MQGIHDEAASPPCDYMLLCEPQPNALEGPCHISGWWESRALAALLGILHLPVVGRFARHELVEVVRDICALIIDRAAVVDIENRDETGFPRWCPSLPGCVHRGCNILRPYETQKVHHNGT